jgi:hypothetical protein
MGWRATFLIVGLALDGRPFGTDDSGVVYGLDRRPGQPLVETGQAKKRRHAATVAAPGRVATRRHRPLLSLGLAFVSPKTDGSVKLP